MERAPVARPTTAQPTTGLEAGELLLVGLLVGLIVISVVGNCLVCLAIFTDRRLRKLGNAFIVSLAIADLFVSCLVMTFALCNDLMNYWIFGDWFCDVWISFDIMCCTASILNLCAISLDRFIHIKDCLLYNQWMTRRVAISAVIIIWFISGLVSFVPINLGWHKPDHFATTNERQRGLQQQEHQQEQHQQQRHQQLNSARGSTKLNYSQPASGLNSLAFAAAAIENQSLASSEMLALLTPTHMAKGKRVDVRLANSTNRLADFVSSRAESLLAPKEEEEEGAQFNQVESNPQNGSQIEREQLLAPAPAVAPESTRTPLERQATQNLPLPLCMLTLTPTYAIISSAISFYIPCIIMLGLYTKLFACARRHVRNIQAISKAPVPIAARLGGGPSLDGANSSGRPLKTWLKLERKQKSNAQTNDKSSAGEHESKPTVGADLNLAQAKADADADQKAFHASKVADLERPETKPNLGLPHRDTKTDVIKFSSDVELETTRTDQEEGCPFLDESGDHQAASKASELSPTTNRSDKSASITIKTNPQVQAQYQYQQQQSGQLATHKAAITLGIIMGTFLFCWVPFFCLNIIKAFCIDCIPSSVFRAFTWLGYANSALNPLIYGIHNSEFRCAFNRIFFKHLNIKNSRYYLNRRFSYDLRQSNHRNRSRSRKSISQADSKQSYKSDTAA